MSKNEIGEDSPIPKFVYLKIQRRNGVETLTPFGEGEFKVPTDDCINQIGKSLGKIWNGWFYIILA